MARPPRLQKLTFSLLKEGMSRSDALRDPKVVTAYRVSAIDAAHDSLFVTTSPPHAPAWMAYLEDHVPGPLDDLYTASASAALLFDAGGRLFAVTFGQGRYLLEAESFVQDFGLKVVLNTVAPDQLKSVDAKTVDETIVHTRRDVSRDSSFSAFGLDIRRDLLRAVTGTPRDNSLAHRLTGADALGIQTRAQVPELPALAERLLAAYGADDYKEHFDFIDYLRPERDPARVRQLQDMLVADLRARTITDAHLAAPETLDWLDLDGFRFSSLQDGGAENDPRISTYLNSRDVDDLDIALLKEDRMLALRASDGQPVGSWSILRCLVYQVELDGVLYVLSAGDWFRVDVDFKDQLYAEVNELPVLDIGLPDADPGTDEHAYCRKAAATVDALCLDRKLAYEEGPDKMEICDVLTRSGGLIHVKHRGSSSTLSHLFAQGLNCAERLLLDAGFRAKARAVAEAEDPSFVDALPAERPTPQEHEVSFVVITRSERATPLTLPFFSVVSLRAAARRLDALGFRVSIAAVREG